jgi:hypothetical protein
MKQFYLLTVFIMITALGFGQNSRSDGQVLTNFIGATPPQQFSGQEIFRFQPGLVTQLQNGNNFGFTNSRWFSLGQLNTASQMVYGLRFQLLNKALTFGYQDLSDDNPRIQWIGTGEDLGNLEFRVANSFTSTSSTLVAAMTPSGSTIFGGSSGIAPITKVSIGNNLGESAGVYVETAAVTTGTSVFARSFGNTNNIGVRGSVGSFGLGGFAYGIWGTAFVTPGSFAGFFDGDVHVNGTFTHTSDRNLKDNLKQSETVLIRLAELKSYTYNFKPNENITYQKGNSMVL